VHWKSSGNPLFAGQFLTSLAEEGLLAFDSHSRSWTWDLGAISAKDLTDDPVDLMIGRLRRLPAASQEVLKLLDCLGSHADFTTLAKIHSGSDEDMHASFRAVVRAGVIRSQDGSYRFLHDRVQEAAYGLIPVESRTQLHLRIGRLLSKDAAKEKVAEKLYDIVNNGQPPRITSASARRRSRSSRVPEPVAPGAK
jgi:predicted ATPase